MIGLFVIIALVMIRSQAQDITANVQNTAPTIAGGTAKLCPGATASDNTSISNCTNVSPLTLTAGGTTNVSYVVQVSDDNGIDDVNSTATGVYFDSTVANAACTADNNDCYRQNNACTKITPTINSTTAWFRCNYTVQYYANDSINWNGFLRVEDTTAGFDTDTTYSNTIAKLIAGTFPTVNFGTVALGFTTNSTNNQDVLHANNGNVLLDINTRLDDTDADAQVDCTTGGIPDDNFTFDNDEINGDVAFGSAARTLTVASPGGIDLDINIASRTDDSSAQGPNNPRVAGDDFAYSYWNIQVPTSGVLGSCSEELLVSFKEAP